MADEQRLICESRALLEGGEGVRFEIIRNGETVPAFVIRYDGKPYAYQNRCAHVWVELDWMPGKFFDESGVYLMCSTHGATYEADTGLCVGGPCPGKKLIPLPVVETGGNIYLIISRE